MEKEPRTYEDNLAWLETAVIASGVLTVDELFLTPEEVDVGSEHARQTMIDIRRWCWFADQDLDDVTMFVINPVKEAIARGETEAYEKDTEFAAHRHRLAEESLRKAEQALAAYRKDHAP